MTDSVKYGARWTFPAQDSAEWVEARKKAAAEPGAALLFAYCGLQEYPDPQVCAWTAVVCKAHHEVLVELKEAKEEIARLKGQAVSPQPAADEDFTRGYLLCLSHLVGGFGSSTEAEHLFREIGSPSAKEVRRLGLCEYDRRNISEVRRMCK